MQLVSITLIHCIVIYMYLDWVAWWFWLGMQSDKDDLSGGWRYPTFEQLGPDCRQLVAIRETTAKLLDYIALLTKIPKKIALYSITKTFLDNMTKRCNEFQPDEQ